MTNELKIEKLKRIRKEKEIDNEALYDNVNHIYYNEQGELDITNFIEDHKNDNILFVRGRAASEFGCCDCRFINKDINQKISYQNIPTENPTRVMLSGILNVCNALIEDNSSLYIISSTKLGFRNGKKDKGPNKELVKEILDVCKDKNIFLNEVVLFHDGKMIKSMIEQ